MCNSPYINIKMEDIPTFNCILVGDAGVGKTTFMDKHLHDKFEPIYKPTLCVDIHSLVLNTTEGHIRFNVWDTAGQQKYTHSSYGLSSRYYELADCAIIMFDVTSRLSYKNCLSWFNLFGSIPIVLIGNKSDISNRKVIFGDINRYLEMGVPYYEVSSKLGDQIDKPFTKLIQILMKNDNIEIKQS